MKGLRCICLRDGLNAGGSSRGFSLVEILVVLAILVVMASMTLKVMTTHQGGEKGVEIASRLFLLARSEAILRQAPVRVIVPSEYDPAKGDSFLNRIALISSSDPTESDGDWVLICKWKYLPEGVYYDSTPEMSQPSGTMMWAMSSEGKREYCYYEFMSNGQIASPVNQAKSQVRFFVISGQIKDGALEIPKKSQSYGFFFPKAGRLIYYPESIRSRME